MKKIWLILLSAIMLTLFCSCNNDTTVPPDEHEIDALITTGNIQYRGWTDFVSDNNYCLSNKFGTQNLSKVNLITGDLSLVCMKINCKHGPFYPTTDNEGDKCPVTMSPDLCFMVGNKVYYKRYDLVIPTHENPKQQKVYHFSSYDIMTGEVENLLTIETTDYERMFRFIQHGGYAYYMRYIAKAENPDSKDDFILSFCRMSLKDKKQEVLFDAKDAPFISDGQSPNALAVDGDYVYFISNSNGGMWRCGIDGSNVTELIKGGDGFKGIYDAYGTFYRDGYIYFTSYVREQIKSVTAKDALFIYRINGMTGEMTKLTEDYARWLLVSDSGIYYEMSKTQPTADRAIEANTFEATKKTIKFMKHDGSEATVIGVIDDAVIGLNENAQGNTIIQGVWGAGNYLFCYMGGVVETSSTQTALMGYTISYNLVTKEIHKYEDN